MRSIIQNHCVCLFCVSVSFGFMEVGGVQLEGGLLLRRIDIKKCKLIQVQVDDHLRSYTKMPK